MPVSLPGSCRCLGSAQPEILIQDMHRTGFSTGSAKGDRDRKKPRGQEGSRPVVVGGGPAQTPLVPAGSTVSPSSSGASLAQAQTLLLTLIRQLAHSSSVWTQLPTHPIQRPAPHLSGMWAQPGEIPGWTQLLPALFPTPPTPSPPQYSRLLRWGGGAGSQQAGVGGSRGGGGGLENLLKGCSLSSPRHKGPGRPSPIHLAPVAVLRRPFVRTGSEGLTSAPSPDSLGPPPPLALSQLPSRPLDSPSSLTPMSPPMGSSQPLPLLGTLWGSGFRSGPTLPSSPVGSGGLALLATHSHGAAIGFWGPLWHPGLGLPSDFILIDLAMP